MSTTTREPRRRFATSRALIFSGHVQVPSTVDVELFNAVEQEIIDCLQREINQYLDEFKIEIESLAGIDYGEAIEEALGSVNELIEESAEDIKQKIRNDAAVVLGSFTTVSQALQQEFDDSVEAMMMEIDTIVSSEKEMASEIVEDLNLERVLG